MPDFEGPRMIGQAASGLVSDTLRIASVPVSRYRALPEGPDKNRKRAAYGTGILTAGLYFLRNDHPDGSWASTINAYFDEMQEPFARNPTYYIGTGLMVLGLLWLVVGLRGSRGPRHVMGAVWGCVVGVACTAALQNDFGLDFRWLSLDYLIEGIYTGLLAGSLMAVYVNLRGPGSGAVAIVQRHILRQMTVFRLGRKTTF